MTDKAYAVPLHEQLASVPRDARLIIDDADGRGTRFIPVGRMCHEAAEALRARLAQPEPAECDGGQCGIGGYCKQCPKTQQEPTARDINKVILDSIHDSSEVVAPPKREWQGLTDEEMFNCLAQTDGEAKRLPLGFKWFAEAIEAKLKEKNA